MFRRLPIALLLTAWLLVSALLLGPHLEAAPAAPAARTRSDGTSRTPNLLLITLDTTRPDRFGCYGSRLGATPRLDRLAAAGLVAQQAFSVVPLTLPAHASLMTGLYPPRHGVHDNADFRLAASDLTLAEQLRSVGYRTGAVVGAVVLGSAVGIDQGFERYDQPRSALPEASQRPLGAAPAVGFQEILERRADDVTDRAMRMLGDLQPGPFFLWVHYFDPHVRYEPPQPYRDRFPTDPYSGEVAFMDAQIGRLLDRLAADGLNGETLVIAVADHGESLGEHGEETHGIFVYDATVRVPLIARFPGRIPAGRSYPGLLSLVDLAPTALELLGVLPPREAHGVSHAAAWRGGATPERAPLYLESLMPQRAFGWAPLLALRSAGEKFIAAPLPELYDLKRDPRELQNRQAGAVDEVARWGRRLDELVAQLGTAPEETEVSTDPERRAALEALGYVSGGSRQATASIAAPAGGDPKVMLPLSLQLDQARIALGNEHPGEARRLAELVLVRDPSNPTASGVLGMALVALGASELGVERLRQAAAGAPSVHELQHNLGAALVRLRRPAEALQPLVRAVAIQPENGETLFLLGTARLDSGDAAGAIAPLRAALAARRATPGAHAALAAALERTGSLPAAEAELSVALELDPDSAPLWTQRAALLERLERHGEAITALERAVRALESRSPGAPETQLARARWSIARGELAAARRELNAVAAREDAPPAVRDTARRMLLSLAGR